MAMIKGPAILLAQFARDIESLDGDYTPYGEVISGMDVVERIAQEQTTGENSDGISPDRPVKKIVIEAVVIEGDFSLPEQEMPGYLERKKKAEEEKEKEKEKQDPKKEDPKKKDPKAKEQPKE